MPVQPPREEDQLASLQHSQASSDADLWVAQERIWQNEHQSAEQAIALIERDQRISAIRAECDWLSSQLDEERERRSALEPELDQARAEWTNAEKRASELETACHQLSSRLQQTEAALGNVSRELDVVKTERGDAVMDLVRQQESIAELNLALSQARAARSEMEQNLSRTRAELEHTAASLAASEQAAEESTSEAVELRASLAHARAELGIATADRDRLQAIVREDPTLSEYVDLKADYDRMETELRDTHLRLDSLQGTVGALAEERDALRRERTELQLKVAALRDAHDDTQLQQDNEVLRRMVERLNEELKEAQPEIAKRRRRAASGGLAGSLARAVVARVFVPDPDVAEGR